MLRTLGLALLTGVLTLSCSAAKPAPPVAPAGAAPPAPAPSVAAPAPAVKPAAAAPAEDAGRVVHFRGGRVSLWAPSSMRRPTRLQYLRQDEPLVVVAVSEMTAENEAAAKEMLAGAKAGAHAKDETAVTRGSAQGFWGRDEPDGSSMGRQVLGLSDGLAAAIVIVQYRLGAEPLVKKILDSVTLDSRLPLDPLALSGITLGDDAGFAVSNATSHPVMLFDKGKRLPIAVGEPLLMLVSLPYPRPSISDQELGALLGVMIAQFRPDMDKAIMNSFELSHGQAFVMAVPGKDEGKPVALYAFIARRPDSAFAGFGRVRPAAMKTVAPRFERLLKSISLDDSIFEAGPEPGESPKK